ncbi:hypothetical protein GGQ65_005657 [Rhizobium fabae]|uniref:Uncharacterized protein n=1 Tax=Rhizobium fabae TaxID=573179 RepID=A0A7W6FLV8_9HYPH|nr:hypothetical protein [Rhizobium fabae]
MPHKGTSHVLLFVVRLRFMLSLLSSLTPSSGCRHLLPAGEKGPGRNAVIPTAEVSEGARRCQRFHFSPAGRRCRQADEGVRSESDARLER